MFDGLIPGGLAQDHRRLRRLETGRPLYRHAALRILHLLLSFCGDAQSAKRCGG
jgi:hypothetical protein